MDLFSSAKTQTEAKNKAVNANSQAKPSAYTANDIEVLEGLEPVRRRPGMYIGGTDSKAMHHLVTEVLDNSMDEAVAGFANKITINLKAGNFITISDNGRGIPVDPHPKFKDKSALEVILTTLHSGGKFSDKVYSTSGGLHGVGVSVVNALSDDLRVEILRDGKIYNQNYVRGNPLSNINEKDGFVRKTGTMITFHPDPEIFGDIQFNAEIIYRLACSRAYLFKGVEIHWSCDASFVNEKVPATSVIHFPNGLRDYLESSTQGENAIIQEPFCGEAAFPDAQGRVEWALTWLIGSESQSRTYCNTIHTPQGGAHELGLRNALLKGLKSYAAIVDNKRANIVTSEDVFTSIASIISVFIKNPIFQGQTKEKLLNQEATKYVENAIRNSFENFLAQNPKTAEVIIERIIQDAEERISRKKSKEVSRKTPIKSLRLPGKLTDCNQEAQKGTEIFLVEGDSAGGSAKQARNRETQAILPLKGKILNIASSTIEKIKANQEISDLITALGVETGSKYKDEDLRYEKVVIMTDADVDGAHITSLLLTFFYLSMPQLIENGHLYLAQPPLYKVTQGANNYYVQNDAEKEKLLEKLSKSRGQIEMSRFKGLGEMSAPQLKETTMDPSKRTLIKVMIDRESEVTKQLVDDLMGKNPEPRFKFIQEKTNLIKDNLSEFVDI